VIRCGRFWNGWPNCAVARPTTRTAGYFRWCTHLCLFERMTAQSFGPCATHAAWLVNPPTMIFAFLAPYNARRDSLGEFWNRVYGRHHAVLVITGFYENVPRHLYEHRDLRPGEDKQNLVLEFDPRPRKEMLVACVWDRWTQAGAPDLDSFAAITDEPPEEIAATGHQRCVISLREENLEQWLTPAGVSRERLEAILSERDAPYYEHQIAA